MANKFDLCAFGADMIMEGVVAVPKLLLHNYASLGLQEGEVILILELMSIRDKNPYPTSEDLGRLMGIDTQRIESMLGRLMEQGILSMDKTFDSVANTQVPAYSMQGMMEKISDIWAVEKAQQMEQRIIQVENQALGKVEPNKTAGNPAPATAKTASTLIKTFEKEFGRPLTEIECSNIIEWHEGSGFPQELVLEALKRAVLNQTTNWRYINSILREWDKKNLRTLQEIYLDDARFQAKQSQSKGGKSRPASQKTSSLKDKYKDIYL